MTKIRKAEVKDIKAIQAVASKTWHDTYEQLIPEQVQNKFLEMAYSDEYMEKRIINTLLLVAEENNRMVGFANVMRKEETAELSAIYIDPDYQGKGLGSRLLNELINQLPSYKRMVVEVEKGNRIGEGFYEKKGFQLLEEYEDDFFGHPLQTKKLVLTL